MIRERLIVQRSTPGGNPAAGKNACPTWKPGLSGGSRGARIPRCHVGILADITGFAITRSGGPRLVESSNRELIWPRVGKNADVARTSACSTMLFLAAAGLLQGQSAAERMVSSAVVVFGAYQQGGEWKAGGRGGGFLVDDRHVVTNLSSCCGKARSGQQLTPIVMMGKDGGQAKVIWSSEEISVAVLELEKPAGRTPANLAPMELVGKSEKVFTIIFPSEGDPKGTEGSIQGVVGLEGGSARLYKSSASTDQGNTGSALYDGCGNAVAMNAMMKDGSLYSFTVDSFLDGLKAAGVQVRVPNQPCSGGGSASSGGGGGGKGGSGGQPSGSGAKQGPGGWLGNWGPKGNQWIPVVVILGIAALAFRPATRQQVARVFTSRRRGPVPEPAPYPYPVPPPPPAPAPVRLKGVLRGISGQYAEAAIPLESSGSTLGRDPHGSNLVFGADAGSVSKRHCTVRWDAPRGLFVLEDLGSTNGTFLASGERLAPHVPRDLRPGERFYIGDLRNQFEVALES